MQEQLPSAYLNHAASVKHCKRYAERTLQLGVGITAQSCCAAASFSSASSQIASASSSALST
jgi:hypothetical protein